MCFSIRDQFFASYLRQQFCLPDSIIYYILKNPQSSKVYQKLIQSCKYFFVKNPILVFHCLHIEDGGWTICSDNCRAEVFTRKINVNKETLSGCKLWIQNELFIFTKNPKYASDLISNVFQCDAERLLLCDQKLSLQQFLFYAKQAKRVGVERSIIYSDDDSEMLMEEIIVNLPEIERFVLEFNPLSTAKISSDTVKKLLEIPHFKYINYFVLMNASEEFDIDAYYKYFKNSNTNFTFEFHYRNAVSEDYAKRLEEILSELLLSVNDDRLVPLIYFPGQDAPKITALYDIYAKKFAVLRN